MSIIKENLSVIISVVFLVIIIIVPLYLRSRKAKKQESLVEKQSKKIEELNKKEEEENSKYKDFTDGHLY